MTPALREFLVQRYDDLKRRLTRHLGNAELASDALQDAWLRLESREDLGPVRDMGAYLMRIAVNIAIDHQRSRSRVLSAEEIEGLLEHPETSPGPAQVAEARSDLDALVKIIQTMPERRQRILLMVRWERLPQQEVADRLGVSLRTVEQELRKAHDFCATRLSRSAEPLRKK
ncbi:RNA polymerase sigma factor [Pararobbsia silviterrae]|uniref:RNA polymerase sigma factor n=1 Tax=Pararobbsia silviterrae TaxID=1792498 RepID=UPI001F0B90EF|nr:sigma-70 family RNA polymerase sigma factor [Pararobbsia silviterrae]